MMARPYCLEKEPENIAWRDIGGGYYHCYPENEPSLKTPQIAR